MKNEYIDKIDKVLKAYAKAEKAQDNCNHCNPPFSMCQHCWHLLENAHELRRALGEPDEETDAPKSKRTGRTKIVDPGTLFDHENEGMGDPDGLDSGRCEGDDRMMLGEMGFFD